MTETLTEDQLLAEVETSARALCGALVAAIDGGVPQIKLMPQLITILREAGLLPEGRLPFGLSG